MPIAASSAAGRVAANHSVVTGSGFGWQRSRLAREVLRELVEGAHVESPGRLGDLARLVGQQPSEGRVEAHEQRLEAFLRELPGLGHGQHRLARPGPTDDRCAADPAQRVEDVALLLCQPDDLAIPVGDLGSQEGPQFEWRGHRCREETDARGPGRSPGAARPQREAAVDPGPDARVARPLRIEDGLVEDEVRIGAHAQVEHFGAEAGDLHVREGHGVTDDRVEIRGPFRQLAQLGDEAVVAVGGLLERRALELAVARPPAALAVAGDRAAFDLHDQETLVRMGDDDVRLALTLDAAPRPDDPRDVLEQHVVARQGVPKTFVDVALGALPEGLGGADRRGRPVSSAQRAHLTDATPPSLGRG